MSQNLVLQRQDTTNALTSVLDTLSRQSFGGDPVVAALRRFAAQPGRFVDFPDELHPKLVEVLRDRGYERLYSHQREAYEAALAGQNTVVVTPTASGKTLCYNLPVLDLLLKEPDARALYLFPTKALSQDQLAELHGLVEALGADIGTFTYDGDTPQDARKAIRSRAHVVVTNPDMLHKGVLPHHTKWVKLFENLRYVIVDELHSLRGVYGSHVANVFRRLQRLCRFYGSDPQFLCSSATIGNPRELAEALTGRPMAVIDESGAPRGERFFAIYNPPVVNRQLGIRRSALGCARDVGLAFLRRGLQTILFAPSRLATEVLVTYLKQELERQPGSEGLVRGYRGGYLPLKRREIERGLREGSVLGVVSTNALELGIDIGGLDAAVLLGYPGSVASAWQQAGRAGRRSSASVAVLVANSTPLNQFIAKHPDYFFDSPVEQARINPDNLHILVNHVKCAAFELPFSDDESFGGEDLPELLRFLEEERVLHRAGGRWHWTSESYPADAVALRSVSSDNFVVQDVTREPRIIAEVDFDSAPAMLHEKAIYILEGRTYLVERYDHGQRRAEVREAEVDYYTDAITYTKVRILDRFEDETLAAARRNRGEVHVTSQVVGFKKIKFYTNENVGSGELAMPENEMHTTAYWLTVPRAVMAGLAFSSEEKRDGVVALAYTLGQLAALFLMCDRHDLGVALGDGGEGEARVERGHRRLPPGFEAPAPAADYEPNVFIYDNYPGGIGLSEPLYRLHPRLLAEASALIASCACRDGCPSCVGPVGEVGSRGKEVARALLESLQASRG
ncbi:MAG TPA: DEAD/DEAH box helicase [Vicinamibacteria bacterium]|nr:DEAD/DEAH box helicase [Vicinamibacteria bacterium]